MQTDPIGYKDQMNMYAYVGNDPVNKTDPTGMMTFDNCKSAGGGQYNCGFASTDDKKPNASFVAPLPAATAAATTATAAATDATAATAAGLGLSTLAVAIGAAYSPKLGDGTVGSGGIMFHYSPIKVLNGPLRAGNYLTPTFGYSSNHAINKLALDGKQGMQLHIHAFKVNVGQFGPAPNSILGTNIVAPLGNLPGGGVEFLNTVDLTPVGPSVPAPQ